MSALGMGQDLLLKPGPLHGPGLDDKITHKDICRIWRAAAISRRIQKKTRSASKIAAHKAAIFLLWQKKDALAEKFPRS